MTGTSKAFTVGVYLLAAVVTLVLGAMVWPPLGIIVGLVFVVLALRVAWSENPHPRN